jgi:multiple sugar transport system ATP-binding protein
MHQGVIQQLAAPKEIYQRPVNRFVAGFVGSPAMNFVDGTLSTDGGPALITDGGVPIRLGGYQFAAPPEAGRKVVLGIRPEQIHVARSAVEATALPLALTLIEPMGADNLLWGTIGEHSVSIRVGPDEEHRIGERIEAYFQPKNASLFDATSGARL